MVLITYWELEHARVKAYRSGRIYRLSRLERAYLRACTMLAKAKRVLVNPKVVQLLRGILSRIMPPRMLALEEGFRRVCEMFTRFKRSGVFKWASQVKLWLRDRLYQLYLGFMSINEPPRLVF